jgi:hypothetical protein
LKRAVFARDRGCTFPGCERKRYLDAHHLEHWAHGGETRLENLTLLCTHHHRLLHEGGFAVERAEDGSLTFMCADGRVIPRFGYRTEDFTDDGAHSYACSTPVPKPSAEVREPRSLYRVVG